MRKRNDSLLFFYRGCAYGLFHRYLILPWNGAVVRRASHIEPASWALRKLFHGLRRIFGDRGRVADRTRQWSCNWRIDFSPTVGGIVGPFNTRADALAHEQTALCLWFMERLREERRGCVFKTPSNA
jgi:hypothetical protein